METVVSPSRRGRLRNRPSRWKPNCPTKMSMKCGSTMSRHGRRLVAAIEIVSPSNKDRPESRRAFVAKVAALLQHDVSVSLVDIVTIRQFNLYADLLELIGRSDPMFGAEPPALYAVTTRGASAFASGHCWIPGSTRWRSANRCQRCRSGWTSTWACSSTWKPATKKRATCCASHKLRANRVARTQLRPEKFLAFWRATVQIGGALTTTDATWADSHNKYGRPSTTSLREDVVHPGKPGSLCHDKYRRIRRGSNSFGLRGAAFRLCPPAMHRSINFSEPIAQFGAILK